MRCPSCGRQNTPERLFCRACAAELVPQIVEQFEPPRARDRRRRQVREAAQVVHHGAERFDAEVGVLESHLPNRAQVATGLRNSVLLLAALFPGLSHLLQGERQMGRRLLLAGVISLLTWLVWMGSFWGTLGALTLASVAVTSVVDAVRLRPRGERSPLRLRFILLGLALVCLSYLTALQVLELGWQRAVVSLPIRIVGMTGDAGLLFREGDHALISKLSYRGDGPQRGDIVLATMSLGDYDVTALQRVIAVPGDVVEFAGGKLTVNGTRVPPEDYPLQPENQVRRNHGGGLGTQWSRLRSWSGTVSRGLYLVWGVDLPDPHGAGDLVAVGPTTIPKQDMIGKAWILYSPYQHRRLL